MTHFLTWQMFNDAINILPVLDPLNWQNAHKEVLFYLEIHLF